MPLPSSSFQGNRALCSRSPSFSVLSTCTSIQPAFESELPPFPLHSSSPQIRPKKNQREHGSNNDAVYSDILIVAKIATIPGEWLLYHRNGHYDHWDSTFISAIALSWRSLQSMKSCFHMISTISERFIQRSLQSYGKQPSCKYHNNFRAEKKKYRVSPKIAEILRLKDLEFHLSCNQPQSHHMHLTVPFQKTRWFFLRGGMSTWFQNKLGRLGVNLILTPGAVVNQ